VSSSSAGTGAGAWVVDCCMTDSAESINQSINQSMVLVLVLVLDC